MYRYVFVVETTVTQAIEVEAESLDEAVAKAKSADEHYLCHQCSSTPLGSWSIATDGEPQAGTLVDFHYGDPGSGFEKAEDRWGQILRREGRAVS